MFATHDIYTDGSARAHGRSVKASQQKKLPARSGSAGWAFLIVGPDLQIEKCGVLDRQLSHQAEQNAVLKAFEHIEKDGNFTGTERFRVLTDCINTIKQYDNFMQRVQYSGKTFVEVVKASDYNNSKQFWLAMSKYLEMYPVVFWHIRAHNDHAYNDRVDQLSRWAWKRPELVVKEGLAIH